MKVLVFGQTGQVARELKTQAPFHNVTVEFLGRDKADLSNPQVCAERILDCDADAIINAAAYTAVDQAETESALAQTINAEAPGAMAHAAAERDLPFLHISTDYVFDGSGVNHWQVDSEAGPLGVYGRTKLDGERQVLQAGGWHAILRTSWVFSAHGNNFVKTILRLAGDRDKLSIVADQIGGPTPAVDIAHTLLTIAKTGGQFPGGVFHYSGAPEVSWAEFAQEIVRIAGFEAEIQGIPTSDYPTPASRPLNGRLDCSRISEIYNIPRPDWRAGLTQVIEQLTGTRKQTQKG